MHNTSLVNVFYRKDFGRVDLADVKAGDYDYVCDLRIGFSDTDAALGVTFGEMNAVHGDETCCRLRLRSMSVGDVVAVEGRAYLCASFGWKEIEDAGDFATRVEAGDFA
jgi:hypothetical protein